MRICNRIFPLKILPNPDLIVLNLRSKGKNWLLVMYQQIKITKKKKFDVEIDKWHEKTNEIYKWQNFHTYIQYTTQYTKRLWVFFLWTEKELPPSHSKEIKRIQFSHIFFFNKILFWISFYFRRRRLNVCQFYRPAYFLLTLNSLFFNSRFVRRLHKQPKRKTRKLNRNIYF